METESVDKLDVGYLISSYFQVIATKKSPLEASDYAILSEIFNLTERHIRKIIKDYNDQISNGVEWPSLTPKYPKLKLHLTELKNDKLNRIITCIQENNYKITIREISILTNIPKSTVSRIMKKNGIVTRYSYARPMLTKKQELNRLHFVRS